MKCFKIIMVYFVTNKVSNIWNKR